MLRTARRSSLGDEVTRGLRQAILGGHYPPGHHLTEAEVAREMGVSHGPVRDALRELEAEELVVILPHRGAFVKAFTAGDLREIYSLRCVLETAMVRLAIGRADDAFLAELDTLVAEMRGAIEAGDVPGLIELDLAFHGRIAEQSGHRRLAEAWRRLASPIRLFLTMAIPTHLGLHDAVESHPPIVAALRRRDLDALIEHMERGVLDIGERIAAAMGDDTVVIPVRRVAERSGV